MSSFIKATVKSKRYKKDLRRSVSLSLLVYLFISLSLHRPPATAQAKLVHGGAFGSTLYVTCIPL